MKPNKFSTICCIFALALIHNQNAIADQQEILLEVSQLRDFEVMYHVEDIVYDEELVEAITE